MAAHNAAMLAGFDYPVRSNFLPASFPLQTFISPAQNLPPHASHPDFGHLTLLVFEAVLEVVFVSLPGYIVARQGMFDADAQKFVANLNVMVFTPCLIFTKLASQLTAEKLLDLAIIPFIFVAQIVISWLCAWLMSKVFRFQKRPRNFVTAMAVFGNSNSLPISLVLSLSKTISGLHWDAVPGDNDDEVAARGILYLMVFQQLGQFLRWTWGYNVLLAPKSSYEDDDHPTQEPEDGVIPPEQDIEAGDTQPQERLYATAPSETSTGERTPLLHGMHADSLSTKAASSQTSTDSQEGPGHGPGKLVTHQNEDDEHIASFPSLRSAALANVDDDNHPRTVLAWYQLWKRRVTKAIERLTSRLRFHLVRACKKSFKALPNGLQRALRFLAAGIGRFLRGLWEFMNPPLWAMLAALLVASIPRLQHLFFTPGTFINNSITRAVSQSGGVAVPLILVVLGANLARNTLPQPDDPETAAEERQIEGKLVVASIVSRMLLPMLIMAPLIAVVAKFVPVSILDDPIFVIVVFLLTGAPSALQLAQICQLNNVYMGSMARLLFQSYVVWILPSTLILVTGALEVVEWAQGMN